MPLIKYQFKSGIDREGTSYTAEGGWYNSDKMRFRSGNAEKIGGWIKYSASTFLGTARSLYNYAAAVGTHYLGIGTNLKFYVADGVTYNDVTPIRDTNTGTATFTCTSGSSTVSVTDSSNGAVQNDFVTFSSAATLGSSNITSTVLNQEYQIADITSTNVYTIVAKDTDGDEVTADASVSGGS